MRKKIEELIEKELNPQLKFHAASCKLVSTDDGVVTLKLFGGCSGCPSSIIALFNTIAPVIKEKFPDVKDVILD